MRKAPVRLTDAERTAMIQSLAGIRDRLDLAQEYLVAVHIAHALDCLDPNGAIARRTNGNSAD